MAKKKQSITQNFPKKSKKQEVLSLRSAFRLPGSSMRSSSRAGGNFTRTPCRSWAACSGSGEGDSKGSTVKRTQAKTRKNKQKKIVRTKSHPWKSIKQEDLLIFVHLLRAFLSTASELHLLGSGSCGKTYESKVPSMAWALFWSYSTSLDQKKPSKKKYIAAFLQ